MTTSGTSFSQVIVLNEITNSYCVKVIFVKFRNSHRRCSIKKGVFKNFSKFTGKHLCQSLFFNEVFLIKNQVQMFSCEFCQISKYIFFTEHLLTTAPGGLVVKHEIKNFNPIKQSQVLISSMRLIYSYENKLISYVGTRLNCHLNL